MNAEYLIGIDEAGRGPLAGPVAVGVVAVPIDFDFSVFANVKDSKKVSPRKREVFLQRMHDTPELHVAVGLTGASVIDKRGIVTAVQLAMRDALAQLPLTAASCLVLLDGSLYAPRDYLLQSTIIRGDELEPVISLASIAAKVTRDRVMQEVSKRYPEYGFEEHKGYGTKKHIEQIRSLGISPIHRRSFLTRIVSKVR